MRKEPVVFVAILAVTAAAAQLLPGYLGLPSGLVQDRILLVFLPVMLLFIGWTR